MLLCQTNKPSIRWFPSSLRLLRRWFLSDSQTVWWLMDGWTDGWGGGGMSGGEKEMIEAINISSILIKASLWNKSM